MSDTPTNRKAEAAAFTPGPWVVDWRTGMARAHYGHNVSCKLHDTPGSISGCCSIAEVRGHNDIEAAANARLIAAAPDLYKACKAFSDRYPAQFTNWHDYPSEDMDLLSQVRSALAKAGGA